LLRALRSLSTGAQGMRREGTPAPRYAHSASAPPDSHRDPLGTVSSIPIGAESSIPIGMTVLVFTVGIVIS
jgi:hypothetical protein